jgi:twitching motility two-component system response regulator PilH
VDDSVAQLHELSRICEELGGEIVGKAMNGADAVREVKAKRPNLVLMDLMMPDIDGFVALRMLTKGLPGTRVAIVSSLVTNVDRARECHRQGAIAVFSKPVDTDQMKELFDSERQRLSTLSPNEAPAERA